MLIRFTQNFIQFLFTDAQLLWEILLTRTDAIAHPLWQILFYSHTCVLPNHQFYFYILAVSSALLCIYILCNLYNLVTVTL